MYVCVHIIHTCIVALQPAAGNEGSTPNLFGRESGAGGLQLVS